MLLLFVFLSTLFCQASIAQQASSKKKPKTPTQAPTAHWVTTRYVSGPIGSYGGTTYYTPRWTRPPQAWGIPVSYVGKVRLHDSKGGSGRPKLYDALAVETSKTDVFKSIQGIFINGMGYYIVFELAAKRADGALYTYQPVRVNL